MRVIELVVELKGNREVTINGLNSARGQFLLEEKVIEKNLTLEQQHHIMCELRKLISRMLDVNHKSRIRAGEVVAPRTVVSGAKGVSGTSIKAL